jgi:hypothetical protein
MRQLVEPEMIGGVIPLDSNLPEENQDISDNPMMFFMLWITFINHI